MPQTLTLWPNSPSDDPRSHPTLTPVLRDDQDRPLLLVLPGGGYGGHAEHEAEVVARAFHRFGLHGAVLRYRLAPNHTHPDMLHDAQRAARLVRAQARDWHVAGGKLAVLGFSAGGHLASSLAVHYDRFPCAQDDLAGQFSARPDAAVLCYPVIDMAGSATHTGSRRNLLGPEPPAELMEQMSTQKQVDAQTPPTFLWHTADDPGVPVDNSLQFFAACRRHKVPAELHVFETGAHGLGLGHGRGRPDVGVWVDLAGEFLKRHLG